MEQVLSNNFFLYYPLGSVFLHSQVNNSIDIKMRKKVPLIYGDSNDSVTSSVKYEVNFDRQCRILFGAVKLSSGYDEAVFS